MMPYFAGHKLLPARQRPHGSPKEEPSRVDDPTDEKEHKSDFSTSESSGREHHVVNAAFIMLLGFCVRVAGTKL